MAEATSLEAVKVQLSMDAADDRDDTRLGVIVDAVNALVDASSVGAELAEEADYPKSVQLGAAMLAARLYRRKNSPAGVESFGQLGAAYVMRNDPDIAQLLHLGSYQAPQIG